MTRRHTAVGLNCFPLFPNSLIRCAADLPMLQETNYVGAFHPNLANRTESLISCRLCPDACFQVHPCS